jgi:hypothetical protein
MKWIGASRIDRSVFTLTIISGRSLFALGLSIKKRRIGIDPSLYGGTGQF